MKNVLTIIVALISFAAQAKSLPPFQISFGSGGGFTGLYNTYTISNDGKLYKEQSTDKSKVEIASLKKKEVKCIEALITKVDFPNLSLNKPANMSSFLNLTKDGKAYNNTWSGSTSGNAALDELYQKLNSFIPKK